MGCITNNIAEMLPSQLRGERREERGERIPLQAERSFTVAMAPVAIKAGTMSHVQKYMPPISTKRAEINPHQTSPRGGLLLLSPSGELERGSLEIVADVVEPVLLVSETSLKQDGACGKGYK